MKRIPMLLLVIALSLSVVTGAEAVVVCELPGFNALPANTPIYLGPLMSYYAVNFPDVGSALAGGVYVWNGTDVNGHIGGYGGQTNSDCPLGQPGPQIGAYNFSLLSKLTGIGTPDSRFLGRWDGPEGVAQMRFPTSAVPITQGPTRPASRGARSADRQTGDRARPTDPDA